MSVRGRRAPSAPGGPFKSPQRSAEDSPPAGPARAAAATRLAAVCPPRGQSEGAASRRGGDPPRWTALPTNQPRSLAGDARERRPIGWRPRGRARRRLGAASPPPGGRGEEGKMAA